MIRVYSSSNLAVVKMAHDILLQAGINCVIRNDRVSSAAGEVPWTEVWPEVWVYEPADADAARAALVALTEQPPDGPDWTCSCGESSPPQFSHCWSCGASRPE